MSNADEELQHAVGVAGAGLPDAPAHADATLRDAGIDPDRLSIAYFGDPARKAAAIPLQLAWPLGLGLAGWVLLTLLARTNVALPGWLEAPAALAVGLLILSGACNALVTASQRLAARLGWNHYVAGTAAEVLSTLPELVVIAFLVPVSPLTAFIVAVITIYNNALVFSIYSFFLPKDRHGKFVMPVPITHAGAQILVAGAAMGMILGLVMMAMAFSDHPKNGFAPLDLIVVGAMLLVIFAVYVYRLLHGYARVERRVHGALDLSAQQIATRRQLVYRPVHASSWGLVAGYLAVGIVGAMLGGEQVADFARLAISEFAFNPIATALVLVVFAGMSEYLILWQSHRRGEYGIALANSFGGITQVMFMVLPFTLLAIGVYQGWINPAHAELPLQFSFSNILLLLFLFPMLFVLVELLQEDHTLDVLDTTIMLAIFALLLALLLGYGVA